METKELKYEDMGVCDLCNGMVAEEELVSLDGGHEDCPSDLIYACPRCHKEIIDMKVRNVDEKMYYNSHGISCSWNQMIETEVYERSNNTLEDVKAWEKKYNIRPFDQVIWVTPNKNMAAAYSGLADDHEAILAMSPIGLQEFLASMEVGLCCFKESQGRIIEESDDGDDGYMFILNECTAGEMYYQDDDG